MAFSASDHMSLLRNFTSHVHSKPSAATDPARQHLPTPFSVCVIGASRGIGASIATAYATAGASTVILAARSTAQLQQVAAKVAEAKPSAKVVILDCDISSSSSVQKLALAIKQDVGRLDAVVVNSGYSGPFILRITEGDPDDFTRTMNVNYVGTYYAAHYLIPLLLSTPNGGKQFIAVGSMAAWVTEGPVGHTAYNVSKLAQARLVEMVATQYKADGLCAVNLHPGGVATELAKDAPESIRPLLIDDVGLCGAFCTWLSSHPEEASCLSGRFLASKWDVEELVQRKQEIIDGDLLKARIAVV